jgi:hypothetical protein
LFYATSGYAALSKLTRQVLAIVGVEAPHRSASAAQFHQSHYPNMRYPCRYQHMVIQRSVCAGHLCYETCPQLNEEVLKMWNGCNSSATTLFRTFTISMTSIHTISLTIILSTKGDITCLYVNFVSRNGASLADLVACQIVVRVTPRL